MKRGLFLTPLIATACFAAYRAVVRPGHESWGPTEEEARARLPGDELVAEPAGQVTRAVTIDAPPAAVWPWVVQLGADRGGFYSYDWLENLFGLGIHSADQIVPEWQHRDIGDLVYANAAGSGGWYVMQVRAGEALVLQMANIKAGRPAHRDDPWSWEFAWIFALRETANGATRFIVRERVGFGNRVLGGVLAPVGFVSFVMTRKMLHGIKARAEASPTISSRPVARTAERASR